MMTEADRAYAKLCCLSSPHGVSTLYWVSDWFVIHAPCIESRRVLSMGVVKVDSCEPDWDWQRMMEERP